MGPLLFFPPNKVLFSLPSRKTSNTPKLDIKGTSYLASNKIEKFAPDNHLEFAFIKQIIYCWRPPLRIAIDEKSSEVVSEPI